MFQHKKKPQVAAVKQNGLGAKITWTSKKRGNWLGQKKQSSMKKKVSRPQNALVETKNYKTFGMGTGVLPCVGIGGWYAHKFFHRWNPYVLG